MDPAHPVRRLSYDGASTIADFVLPEAAALFEARTGIGFERIEKRGTGEGWKALMSGAVLLAGMGRDLEPAELARGPWARVIGWDALAVFVHASNPVTGLSRAQLADVFTGKVRDWSELGGPPGPVEFATEPRTGNRTVVAEFKRKVMGGAEYVGGVQLETQADCVAFAAGRPRALTQATTAYQRPGVKMIAVDGLDPTGENVRSGRYLLGRPLILAAKEPVAEEARRFVELVLSPEGQRIVAKHFVPVG